MKHSCLPHVTNIDAGDLNGRRYYTCGASVSAKSVCGQAGSQLAVAHFRHINQGLPKRHLRLPAYALRYYLSVVLVSHLR